MDNYNTNEEVWKPINDFPNYWVSNLGRVKSNDRVVMRNNGMKQLIRGRMIRESYTSDGYAKVSMNKNKKRYTKRVHRLVAENFIPNPNNLPEVNHINGNKVDNSINNLEWCTRSENMKHSYKHGLTKHKRMEGDKARNKKLSSEQVNEIRSLYESGKYTQKHLADVYNVSRGTIHHVVRNITWDSLKSSKRSEISLRSKLTDAERLELFDLYTNGIYSQREIGEIYGITQTAVSKSIKRTKKKKQKQVNERSF